MAANNNHFGLTLDTLAPTGSITRSDAQRAINTNQDLTITKNADAVYMKTWFDTDATGSKSSAGYIGASWVAADTKVRTAFVSDGSYYYHLVLMDDVNNESDVYDTAIITFDTVAPVISNAYLADPITGSQVITNAKKGIKYHFVITDAGSGPADYVITSADVKNSPITVPTTDSTINGTFDFIDAVLDGEKSVTIIAHDAAGNVSATTTVKITLDTVITAPVITLLTTTESALPSYINYHDIKVRLTSGDTDIVAYKIWEDGQTEPAYTEQTKGKVNVTIPLTLSANDGVKTIHAKVKDSAGSEASAIDKSVTIDTVKPVVTIESNKSIISNIEGFKKAVLTLSGTDAKAGIKSWDLLCGSTSIKGALTTIPATFDLTSANSMVEGSNTITLTVTDNAENTNSASVNVILDTTAPTASIGILDAWYKAKFDISVTSSDENGVDKFWVWANTSAESTTIPGTAVSIAWTAGTQTITSSEIDWTGLAQSDKNYMHVAAVDVVGNTKFVHSQFGWDIEKPTVSIAFTKSAYQTVSAEITIIYDDPTTGAQASGVTKMRVSGDITNGTETGSWEAIAAKRSVTLTVGDGTKTVTVLVKDAAGNESEAAQATCELDTTTPAGHLALFEANGTTPKAATSSVATFSAKIWPTDDDPLGGVKYQLYGAYTVGSQSATGIEYDPSPTSPLWKDYTPDSGKDFKMITDLYCTSGDGNKVMGLHFMDNAGNISPEVTAAFIYDTTAPVVVVSNPDYNRISKINSLRRNNSGEIAGKYADQVNFTFTPDSKITEWKVCAYVDAAAATTGSHADTAIPMTAGSINMSGTQAAADDPINAMIKGTDYEVAIGGKASTTGEFDGAHIVVVYVKDEAGTWSEAAKFSV